MKLKKILVILLSLIVVVIVSTLLHYQNMNYISENWNIDFPSENTIVYQVKPSPSFTNDGIYYEVQEAKNRVFNFCGGQSFALNIWGSWKQHL